MCLVPVDMIITGGTRLFSDPAMLSYIRPHLPALEPHYPPTQIDHLFVFVFTNLPPLIYLGTDFKNSAAQDCE